MESERKSYIHQNSQGIYHPFWLEEDKKTIKKEYQPPKLAEVIPFKKTEDSESEKKVA